MALVACNPFWWPHPLPDDTAGTASNTIDASGEKSALVFQAHKTGNIDRVSFRTGTVTTGCTLDVRLETVGSDGNPSGSLKGTNTNASQVVTNADDNTVFEVTLTSAAAVTRGDWIAIVIVWGASGVLNISYGNTDGGFNGHYNCHYTTSWAQNMTRWLVGGAVRYDDATYPYTEGLVPISAFGTEVALNTGTTPDEIGIKFTPSFRCKIGGLGVPISNLDASGADDFDLVLYDANSSVLESFSHTRGLPNTAGKYLFDTEITLDPGTTYRAVCKPTTANSITVDEVTLVSGKESASPWAKWSGHKTTRTDAGAWTDDTTKVCWFVVAITALDDGA